jgi:hypothetical protein
VEIENNVVYSCTSNGIEVSDSGTLRLICRNNELVSNGVYGLKTSVAAVAQDAYGWIVDRNNTYNNTSGAYNGVTGTNDPAVDPGYVNTGSGNFAHTAAGVKGVGYPTVIGTLGATTNYRDIGFQHADSGGSGGVIVPHQFHGLESVLSA